MSPKNPQKYFYHIFLFNTFNDFVMIYTKMLTIYNLIKIISKSV